jgi:hypothetical protein
MSFSRLVLAGCSLLDAASLGGCDTEFPGARTSGRDAAPIEHPVEPSVGDPVGPPVGPPGGKRPDVDEPSLARLSTSGAYRVTVRPEGVAAVHAGIHTWLVRIESDAGAPIHPTRLAFSGGMPQHGHGFQTAPHVTEALDGGWFKISGVRFHMAGEWTLRVEFVGPSGPDVAVFQISVPH